MNRKLKKLFGAKPIFWVPMWGISKLRQRGGEFAGEIPGNAQWFDQWYDRAMSRETAEKLAGLGVNLVILPFSLGGSMKAEAAERQDFERMTGWLHEFGIVSLPYLQYQNVLQEENVPDDTAWAEALNGTRRQYCYWRRTACQSSDGFKQYFKSIIADAISRGADGIWIDNNYLDPCGCKLCRAAFVEYLKIHRRDLLEKLYLRDFEHIEIPFELSLGTMADPIAQAFIEFNLKRNVDLHLEFKEYLEALSPDGLFASNPALYRGRNYALRGVDFYKILAVNDLIYLENQFFTEEKAGQTSGNFHGFIAGNAVGVPGIPGAWKHNKFDATSIRPETGMPEPQEMARALLEPVVFGGVVGAFWAVRNVPDQLCAEANDKLKMYFELPSIYGSMKKTLDYIQSLSIFGNWRNLADIATLYHRESLLFDFDRHQSALHGIEELLMTSGIPYSCAFSENLAKDSLKYRLIILPEVRLLSDSDAEILRNFVKAGGQLLILGTDCGRFDEYRHARLDSALYNLSGVSCYDNLETVVFNNYEKGQVGTISGSGLPGEPFINMMSAEPGTMISPSWLSRPEMVVGAIDRLLGGRRLKVDCANKIGVSIASVENRKIVVQLFSYASEPETQDIELTLKATVVPGMQCAVYMPDSAPCELNARMDGVDKVFCVKGFVRHAALIFEE